MTTPQIQDKELELWAAQQRQLTRVYLKAFLSQGRVWMSRVWILLLKGSDLPDYIPEMPKTPLDF